MATVTASHFVSSSCHGTSGSKTNANLAQISQRNQAMTHNGLRSLNNFDVTLRTRSQRSVVARQAVGTVNKDAQNDRTFGQIVCQQGMTVISVSTECSPWCKTGGLGDVVGGLPPALAVSRNNLYFRLFLL